MASSIFHKDLLVVPPEAQYHPKGHSDDLIVSHRLKKVFPENTTPVGENSSIRFHIYGAGQHIDMNSVRLFFNVRRNTLAADTSSVEGKEQLAKLASAPIRFQEWIGSLFRTVEIRLNNQTLISRIDYRNILHHITGIYTINEAWKQSSNGANEGYVNQLAYRNYLGELVPANSFQKAVLATHDQQYCIQFDLENIFTTQKYVPLDLVRSIDIELITEYNNRVLVRDFCQLGRTSDSISNFYTPFISHAKGDEATNSDVVLAGTNIALNVYKNQSITALIEINDKLNGAGGYYSEEIGKGYLISDYYLTADFYQFSDSYRAQLEQTLLSTGIIFPMRGFINISEQLTPGTRHEIRIRRSLTSVKTLFLSFELDSLSTKGELKVNGFNEYYADPMSTFLRHNLKSYQVLLNGVPIQGHRIDTSYLAPGAFSGSTKNAEHILENNKAFKIHGNHVISGTSTAFTSKFQLIPVIEKQSDTATGELSFSKDEGLVFTNLSKLQFGQTDEKFVIGVNLEKCRTVSGSSMQEIVVLFEWEQSTPQNLQLMSFLYYDQHLEIRPGFDFILHE